jgi:hypothetical protein
MESIKTRSKNLKRQTVQITSWVKPAIREDIERLAKREGVSVSQTIAALVEKALQTLIDMRYGAMLEPVIERIIDKKMRSISNRQATLLVRIAFDAGQARGIVTNILGRMPGVTPEILNEILDDSARFAKSRIVARTPQLEGLITELEKQLREQDPDKNK